MTLEEQIQKLTAERAAALKERDDAFATAKYFVEQNAIEVSKRGEAEHQVDLARGDLSEHIAKLECDAMAARVERDAALKACAEMEDVLTDIKHLRSSSFMSETVIARYDHALSSDCGKGYVKAESLRCFKCDDGHTPLYCLNCAREGYHHDDEWKMVLTVLKDIATDDLDRVSGGVKQSAQQALAIAEKLIKGQ